MLRCKAFLDLTIIIYFTIESINKQYLTWLQTSLFGNLARIKVHNSNFTGNNHCVVLRNRVTCRTQTVTV